MSNLHPASLAVGEDDLGCQAGDSFCQILTNLLRDIILLFLESEHPAKATAVRVNEVNLKPWDEPKNLESRESNSERPKMAGSKVGELCRDRLEMGIQCSRSIQISEEFEKIERVLSEFISSRNLKE